MKPMQKVCLDLHDFSVVHNRLDLLLKLKEHFPNFKVSLFTVPIDKTEDWGSSLIREESLRRIKSNLDWIQIIPHGLNHEKSEALMWDYAHTSGFILPLIREVFDRDELPFINGFCAPHWRWSGGVVMALDEWEWWGAIDRNKEMPCPKRFYKYNFLLNEPFWESNLDVLKLHGHIYGTKNDVGWCFDNLLELPLDTEWHFVTDFLETK